MPFSREVDIWLTKAEQLRSNLPIHKSLFYLACVLVRDGYSDSQVLQILRALAGVAGDRCVPDREIKAALASAKLEAFNDRPAQQKPKWPAVNHRARASLEGTTSVEALWEMSPSMPGGPKEALCQLLPGDPLVCIGSAVNRFRTARLSTWSFLRRGQYIVPNPMTEVTGLTLEGKVSARSNANTGLRPYQVVEFDYGELDHQAAIHLHLCKYAPLVLAVYSGGKSLHGWFKVEGWPESKQRVFFSRAVCLGADPKMWTPSQFTRLPFGTNKATNRLQQIYYFNPQ